MRGPLTSEYRAGDEIQAGEATLTLFTKTWQLRAPGSNFTVTWNRPASMLVHRADGEEKILPIPDLTRRIIWSLLGACLGAALLAGIISIFNRK